MTKASCTQKPLHLHVPEWPQDDCGCDPDMHAYAEKPCPGYRQEVVEWAKSKGCACTLHTWILSCNKGLTSSHPRIIRDGCFGFLASVQIFVSPLILRLHCAMAMPGRFLHIVLLVKMNNSARPGTVRCSCVNTI